MVDPSELNHHFDWNSWQDCSRSWKKYVGERRRDEVPYACPSGVGPGPDFYEESLIRLARSLGPVWAEVVPPALPLDEG